MHHAAKKPLLKTCFVWGLHSFSPQSFFHLLIYHNEVSCCFFLFCMWPINCPSHQSTTTWGRQERGGQSLIDLQELWGRVLSNCQDLYPSAIDSGPYSRLYTAERRPKRQIWLILSNFYEVHRGKNSICLTHLNQGSRQEGNCQENTGQSVASLHQVNSI